MTQIVEQPGPKVAIIGAGISGLACARKLYDEGMQVTLFEKSRGLGGRMATRRIESEQQFDHGAQYFTVTDPQFETHVSDWLEEGVIALWNGRISKLTNGVVNATDPTTDRYVGVPGMNSVCHYLAAGIDIRLNRQIRPPESHGEQWHLSDEQGHAVGTFDIVLISAPAPQTTRLLASVPDLQKLLETVQMNGCWAAMLSFEESLNLPFEGAFVEESLLSWIACDSCKPNRHPSMEAWVLHASQEWTSIHLEDDPADVLNAMLNAFWQTTGAARQTPIVALCHRWRYAIPLEPLKCQSRYDAIHRVGVCGDWCQTPRVEGAFLSGLHLAERVLENIGW